jgi:hypothetical protein
MPTLPTDWSERNRDLATLMARTGLGDRAAFATLYERTRAHPYAVILRISRDRALAEDILQEVYVSAWHAASGYEIARSQPLTWLTSIARNRAMAAEADTPTLEPITVLCHDQSGVGSSTAASQGRASPPA